VNKETLDAGLLLKANQATTYTKTEVDTTLSNYNTKTQDTALFKPIAQIENKIENSGLQSSIQCSGPNLINVRSGG
jgi:hypothetical protein